MKLPNSRTIGTATIAGTIGLILGSAIAWSQMARTTIKTVQALEASRSLTQRRTPRHTPSTPNAPRRPSAVPNNAVGERLPQDALEILERDGEYHYRAEGV